MNEPDDRKPAAPPSPPGLQALVAALVGFAGLFALAIALVYYAWQGLAQEPAPEPLPAPVPAVARVAPAGDADHVTTVTLHGPNGCKVRLPMDGPVIVHVWLQACPDCMPSFEAVKRLRREGTVLPCPVVNVAYGSATPEWAAQYGVEEALVFDDGTALVQPLGIGTFTTLVLDGAGAVRAREYPSAPGYLERITAAVRAAREPIPAERER